MRLKRAQVSDVSPVKAPSTPPAVGSGPEPEDRLERAQSSTFRPKVRVPGVGAFLGRAAAGLAASAVVLGVWLGQPSAVTQGVPLDQVRIEAPRGSQVSQVQAKLDQALERVFPGTDAHTTLQQLGQVSFSLQLDRGLNLEGGRFQVDPGARITARLDRQGISLSTAPGAQLSIDWLPDPTIRSIRYEFRTGLVQVAAEGPGPDGIYSSLVERKLVEYLQDKLPPALRQPGYDPWTDPDLTANLQRIVDILVPASAQAQAPAGSSSVSAPALNFSLTIPETRVFSVNDGQTTITLEAGTHLSVAAETTGPVDQPKIDALRLSFHGTPLRIVQGDDPESILKRLELHGITIHPGAQVALDYSLGAEQTMDGVRGLLMLLAVAAEPRLLHSGDLSMSPTRLEFLRERIQGTIDDKVEPALVRTLTQYDDAIPGMSLLDLFGIKAQ